MKIAILTQPLHNNYGGILQNYALQKYLQSLGHSTTTINYDILSITAPLRLLICIKRFLLKYVFRVKGISKVDPQKESREIYFHNNAAMVQFIHQYIHSTMGKWPLTPKFAQNNPFDAYIVGSDQVWRADYTAHLFNYFLDFVTDPNIKKIAYAASFGVNSLNPQQYNIKKIAHLLHQFNAISVREKTGITICQDVLGCHAEHVLDPTLLLTADDYIKQLQLKRKTPTLLIAYILDDTPQKRSIIQQLSQKLDIPVKYIGRHETKISPSIESWLEGILNARFVITDSFHGSVFSILFEKEFITINNSARGATRMTSLFEMMGINPQRILSQETKQIPEFAPIEYTKIRERLAMERTKSKDFLSRALQ